MKIGVSTDVLQVTDLRVYYHTPNGAVKAVNGVTFELRANERLGLVGESGSGKSTIALALLRMIKPPGKIEGGEILLDGMDLTALSTEQMRQVRLAQIALVAHKTGRITGPGRDDLRSMLKICEAMRQHIKSLVRANRASWESGYAETGD